jgi:hypothetical protein
MNNCIAKSFLASFIGGVYGFGIHFLSEFAAITSEFEDDQHEKNNLTRMALYWLFASYGFLFFYPRVHENEKQTLDFQTIIHLCCYSFIIVVPSELLLNEDGRFWIAISFAMPSAILLATILETFEIHDRLRALLKVLYDAGEAMIQDDIHDQ